MATKVFIPAYAIGAFAIILAILVVWAALAAKKKMKEEKLASFGYPLGVILEGILINEAVDRVNEVARRLAQLRMNIPDQNFENLFRAGVTLYAVRNAIEHRQGGNSATLVDVGGEHLRQLGVSVAGSGQPRARELADTTVALCVEGKREILPVDELCGILLKQMEAAPEGTVPLTLQDVIQAQLMVEKWILDVYGAGISTSIVGRKSEAHSAT